jgi:hypothetical protein
MSKEQFIHVDRDGDKFYYSDREMTIQHREDGPAVEYADGYKAWYINGARHREDGPAFEGASPLIEGAADYKVWYINGKYHREDGPAIEYTDGSKEWYINGEELTEEEFNAHASVEQLKIKK